jgi:hypothetical protein
MISCTLDDISTRVRTMTLKVGVKYTFGLHLSALTMAILHKDENHNFHDFLRENDMTYLVFLSDILE